MRHLERRKAQLTARIAVLDPQSEQIHEEIADLRRKISELGRQLAKNDVHPGIIASYRARLANHEVSLKMLLSKRDSIESERRDAKRELESMVESEHRLARKRPIKPCA